MSARIAAPSGFFSHRSRAARANPAASASSVKAMPDIAVISGFRSWSYDRSVQRSDTDPAPDWRPLHVRFSRGSGRPPCRLLVVAWGREASRAVGRHLARSRGARLAVDDDEFGGVDLRGTPLAESSHLSAAPMASIFEAPEASRSHIAVRATSFSFAAPDASAAHVPIRPPISGFGSSRNIDFARFAEATIATSFARPRRRLDRRP